MTRHLYAVVTLGFVSMAIPLHANRPRSGMDAQTAVVWTNDDLEKLHGLGMISIVGRMKESTPTSAAAPGPYVKTQDPDWYAVEAAKLRDQLERRQTQLREYEQALEDVQSLKNTTGGINFDEGDIAITPEAGVEILQQRAKEIQTELDTLDDLARRNDIPPGMMRGQ